MKKAKTIRDAFANGKAVIAIGEYAFADCTALTELIVNGNVRELRNKAFAKCDSLTHVYLTMKGNEILVDTDSLLEETSDKLHFYVAKDLFGSFATDYFWQNYSSRIKAK